MAPNRKCFRFETENAKNAKETTQRFESRTQEMPWKQEKERQKKQNRTRKDRTRDPQRVRQAS